MSVSMNELAQAREIVGRTLEEIGLEAYVFEVEPRDDQWEIRIECAAADGWTSCRLTAAKDSLLRGGNDGSARQALRVEWQKSLSACLRRS